MRKFNSVGNPLSAEFLAIWNDASSKFSVRKIIYKRRYWSGGVFVYEADWQTLVTKDFVQIDAVTQQLDTVKLNVFKMSNITFRLRNEELQWLPGNTNGKFGPDDVAPNGYNAFRTLFKVQAGYELADGTEEMLTLFTGYLTDYNAMSTDDFIEMYITGYEEKLQKADAQLAIDTFTNEATSPAAGDGVNENFATTSEGVHEITKVRVNGATKTEGIDYTIGDTDSYGVSASLQIVPAPANGKAVDASGTKWWINKTVEYLIGKLCDIAGIAEVDRQIDTVLFPNGANGYKLLNTQAAWEDSPTLVQNITTTFGDYIAQKWNLVDDFASLNLDKWASFLTNGYVPMGIYSASAATGAMVLSATSSGAPSSIVGNGRYMPSISKATGTWRWRGECTGTISDIIHHVTGFWFCAYAPYGWGLVTGYGLVYTAANTVAFHKMNGAETEVITGLAAGMHEFIVTRSETGEWKIYVDGILKLTDASDVDLFTGNFGVMSFAQYSNSCTITMDDLWFSSGIEPVFVANTDIPTYISKEFDILAVPTRWGYLNRLNTLNGGGIQYYVESHAAPGGEGTYVAAEELITSDLNRYFKIKIVITTGAGLYVSPSCEQVIANFTTAQIYISLANFSGMTVYSAIERLAKICDYEWGFDGDGKFFCRAKNTRVDVDIILTEKDIVKISSMRPGWKEIVNAAQMRYSANYYKEYNSSTLPETAPTSEDIYGKAILKIADVDFLLANDVDIATGAVQIAHDAGYLARGRVQMLCKLIPHAELGDICQVSFYSDPLKKDIIFGDMLQKGFPTFGETDNGVLLRDKKFKIVGLVSNFADTTSLLTLVEVI